MGKKNNTKEYKEKLVFSLPCAVRTRIFCILFIIFVYFFYLFLLIFILIDFFLFLKLQKVD